MIIFLLPWIVFWSSGAINSTIGGGISLLCVCIMPFFWLKYKAVFYEYVSMFVVVVLSLMLIAKFNTGVVLSVSYAIFGFTWLISAITPKPLSSFYSANNYGGERAFSNPLFIKTNRVLTIAWGTLYIVTSVWTYYLMKTSIASFVGLINSICPLVMGIFTIGFQKWYPAYYARK